MAENLIEQLSRYTLDMMYPQIQIGIINQDEETTYCWNGKELSSSKKDYIYEIGSITKTFTAGILSKAISEKKVKLNETIDLYISDLFTEHYYPTFVQLASHTGGYTNDLQCVSEEKSQEAEKRLMSVWSGNMTKDNLYCHLTEEDLLQTIKASRLENKQYDYFYSNIGYCILGYTLGKAYHSTYDELLLRFIRDDLQLKDTYIGMHNLKDKSRICIGYNSDNENCGNWIWNDSAFKAAGCIYSTLEDMLNYIKIYMDKKISYLTMTHDTIYANSNYGFDVGLAWVKNGNITWHNGGTGCFRSFAGFREDKRKGVVVLSNYYEKNGITVDDIGLSLLNNV